MKELLETGSAKGLGYSEKFDTVNGLSAAIKENDETKSYGCLVWVGRRDGRTDDELERYLSRQAADMPHIIKHYKCAGRGAAVALVKYNDPARNIHNITRFLGDLADDLYDHNYTNCCFSCGSTDNLGIYGNGSSVAQYCQKCAKGELVVPDVTAEAAVEDAERAAREEAERQARAEAERAAREEVERAAREEVERAAREEAERAAREEAERAAREEAERAAREEAERAAREEAERAAREEAERAARSAENSDDDEENVGDNELFNAMAEAAASIKAAEIAGSIDDLLADVSEGTADDDDDVSVIAGADNIEDLSGFMVSEEDKLPETPVPERSERTVKPDSDLDALMMDSPGENPAQTEENSAEPEDFVFGENDADVVELIAEDKGADLEVAAEEQEVYDPSVEVTEFHDELRYS